MFDFQETLCGTVAHITFRNDDNGYTVCKITPDDAHPTSQAPDGTIAVVGQMPLLAVGDRLEITGKWVEHTKYGRQFESGSVEILSSADRGANGAGNGAVTAPSSADEVVTGTVERITYHNAENGYTVVKITPDQPYPSAQAYDGTIAIVGIMPELVDGERVQFSGQWVENRQYGRQFKAANVIPIAPNSKEGILRYIEDTVSGIGPVTALRIYDHFGDETMSVLDEDPTAVRDVPGLKPQLADNLIQAWESNRVQRQIMIHLQSYGISSRMARKIYDQYEAETLNIVRNDPYQLADDVHGIGFKKADVIARGMGMTHDAPERLRAGMVYAMSQLTNDGHTYAPRHVLIEKAADLLGVTQMDMLDTELENTLKAERLIAETLVDGGQQVNALYLPMFLRSERGAATKLSQIANTKSSIIFRMTDKNWGDYLDDLSKDNDVMLSDEQQGAVKAVMTSKISVLTGGPGTGKTTTLQMVIHALEKEGFRYELASPTGRAAKRLSETTHREARTIHRMLGWNTEGGFDYDQDNQLKADVVIIDEASMIDLILFYNLLKAMPLSAHLMLVGDIDQLPSVGAGNVLRNVINSGLAHVTRLQRIFRQTANSHIVINAHNINHGEMPVITLESDDFFFFGKEEAPDAADLVVELVLGRLERKLGDYDRLNDVQVIAPMYRGPVGVHELNRRLQAALNPPDKDGSEQAEFTVGGMIFRKGDKVMQTRNDYENDVFNGDIGFIKGINRDDNSITVWMNGQEVNYDFQRVIEDLIHAYCITTHRSQGSEYPVVVMPVMMNHYMMLQRNLLYTAITRAKRMVVLVGERRAIYRAVKNNNVAERYSGLLARLQ